MMTHLYLKVDPICIEIRSQQILKVSNQFKQFFFENLDFQKEKIICDVKVTNKFAVVHGQLVYQNGERLIFNDKGKETRIHLFQDKPYGIYREIDENHFEIEVISDVIDVLFIEMFALEKYLLKSKALILHSSFISWNQTGIVFTAPSGTGKSTQAALWQKYENATIINGDRSILYLDEETSGVNVGGLPFCGSSNINLNQKYLLKAIVFLAQANHNKATYVDEAYAAQRLFKEISINKWNIQAIDESLNLIQQIIKKVKLISLECQIDSEAVKVLKKLIVK